MIMLPYLILYDQIGPLLAAECPIGSMASILFLQSVKLTLNSYQLRHNSLQLIIHFT